MALITRRQQGLLNAYALICSTAALGWMLAYASLDRWIPRVDLLETVALLPYCVAASLGALASRRVIRDERNTVFHLPIGRAVVLASKQTLYVATAVFAVVFATKDQLMSRLFLGSYLLSLMAILSMMHVVAPKVLARALFSSRSRVPTLLVGRKPPPELLEKWLREAGHIGIDPVGCLVHDHADSGSAPKIPYLGPPHALRAVIREKAIQQVILLDWLSEPGAMESLVTECETSGARCLIYNTFGSAFARSLRPVHAAGQHFLAIQEEPLQDPINRFSKRAFDILLALVVLAAIFPALAVIVMLVQRFQSPGPLMVNHIRGGRDRTCFRMYKFRSMHAQNPDVALQASRQDPRVYPFGGILRRTSLDEIPQFINVLRGEMSVVGPRPHLIQHDEEFSEMTRSYRIRSLVKPGITGLAQVRGFRGEITDSSMLQQRVYWDLHYVAYWSMALDLRIIARTVLQVLMPPKAAY